MLKTTGGRGFCLMILAILFVMGLTVYTIEELAPVTETRLADCEERVADLNEKLSSASADESKAIEKKIGEYESRISMLKNRTMLYMVSMGMIFLFLILALLYQQKTHANFSAPVAALSLLLAIGISFRAVVALTVSDVLFLALAMAAMVAVYFVLRNVKDVKDGIFIALAACIAGLILVNLIFGSTVNGARLWIRIGSFSFQPGELLKVFLIAMCAFSYGKKWRVTLTFLMGAISFATLFLLRDLGSAAIIFALVLGMTVLLLDNEKLFVVLLLITVMVFFAAVTFVPYAHERVENVGEAMELNGQQAQMLKACIFGGLGGLGIENSSHIINIYAIENDMVVAGIYSVFGIGMLLVVMLSYCILVLTPRKNYAIFPWCYFVTVQVSVVLCAHVLLNFLGSLDVLPFTGIVAPFLSKGGTSLLTFGILMGMVFASLNPSVKFKEVEKK